MNRGEDQPGYWAPFFEGLDTEPYEALLPPNVPLDPVLFRMCRKIMASDDEISDLKRTVIELNEQLANIMAATDRITESHRIEEAHWQRRYEKKCEEADLCNKCLERVYSLITRMRAPCNDDEESTTD